MKSGTSNNLKKMYTNFYTCKTLSKDKKFNGDPNIMKIKKYIVSPIPDFYKIYLIVRIPLHK